MSESTPSDTPSDSGAIQPEIDARTGERIWQASLAPCTGGAPNIQTLCARPHVVIPIVFLPGIMGTNLRAKGSSKIVWRPPNGVLEKIGALLWFFCGPKKRQKLLNMKNVDVDLNGPIDAGDCGLSEALLHDRGWGAVIKSAYHPVMAKMQETLNAMIKTPADGVRPAVFTDFWRMPGTGERAADGKELKGLGVGRRDPAAYGGQGGKQAIKALTDDEINQAANYQFDVWCGGYNWLQSNQKSAQDIQTYIEGTVLKYYADKDIPAEKVIIVTHSMGGLVSRALTLLSGFDKVLGVVHGVQPATGAPSFYHHMRCGYEGVAQAVLGSNAGEVTAVVAKAPGALQLAPSFDYDNGNSWLHLQDAQADTPVKSLPESKNPYGEIYTSTEWYGLVPPENTKYLDMSKKQKTTSPKADNPRGGFEKNVGNAKAFHVEIARQYFSETWVHYCADKALHSWQTIEWKGDLSKIGAVGYYDNKNGVYGGEEVDHFSYDGTPRWVPVVELKSVDPQGGDGTVAAKSAMAPELAKAVQASFRHGSEGTGDFNPEKGYEHPESYLDERAQWATLYSIVKIAQLATWHK